MAYEDVPQRLLDGEDVPVSEIIGYFYPQPQALTRSQLSWASLCGVIEFVYDADTKFARMTPFGHTVRIELVKRIEGDCPDCDE